MSDETKKRTAAEIEADLQRTREELTRTVDELSGRVDPRRQVAQVKAKGKGFADDVKAGQPKALAVVGTAAAALVAIIVTTAVRRKK